MNLLKVTKFYSAEIPDNVAVYGGDYSGACNSEDADLVSFVSWIKFNYPHLVNLIYHIPNESMKPVHGIVMDKKKGVLDGAPDVCIALVPAIYIEMKRRCVKQSLCNRKSRQHFSRQLQVLSAMASAGNRCFVAFGLDAAKQIIKELAL
jgi:hypothetical protein